MSHGKLVWFGCGFAGCACSRGPGPGAWPGACVFSGWRSRKSASLPVKRLGFVLLHRWLALESWASPFSSLPFPVFMGREGAHQEYVAVPSRKLTKRVHFFHITDKSQSRHRGWGGGFMMRTRTGPFLSLQSFAVLDFVLVLVASWLKEGCSPSPCCLSLH